MQWYGLSHRLWKAAVVENKWTVIPDGIRLVYKIIPNWNNRENLGRQKVTRKNSDLISQGFITDF